jgi:hypothetical protein
MLLHEGVDPHNSSLLLFPQRVQSEIKAKKNRAMGGGKIALAERTEVPSTKEIRQLYGGEESGGVSASFNPAASYAAASFAGASSMYGTYSDKGGYNGIYGAVDPLDRGDSIVGGKNGPATYVGSVMGGDGGNDDYSKLYG